MPRRRPSPIPTRMATLCTIAWKVSTLSRLKRMMTIGVEARNADRLYLIIHSPAISNSYRGFPRNDTSSIHFIHEQACCLVRHQGGGAGPGLVMWVVSRLVWLVRFDVEGLPLSRKTDERGHPVPVNHALHETLQLLHFLYV